MHQIKLKDILCNPTSVRFIVFFCALVWVIEFVLALLWPLFLNPNEYKTLMFYTIRLVVILSCLIWLFIDKRLVLKARNISIHYIWVPFLTGIFFGYLGYEVQNYLNAAQINYSLSLGIEYKPIYLPIVFLSCLFNEVIFRGFLLPTLMNKYGRIAGILISSLLYAIGFLDLGLFLMFFLQGAILCILYLKTKSLIPSSIFAFTTILINF